jgi:DNA-binding CsgD family transcriptional regulator
MSASTTGDRGLPPGAVYAELTSAWARQTRAYAQSVRLYSELTKRRVGRRPQAIGVLAPEAVPASEPPPVSMTPLRRENGLDTASASGQHNGRSGRGNPLTGRQLEIAEMIARGLTNGQIAEQLVLTPGTVGNHVAHILRRLGAKNRAQVAAWMTRRTAMLYAVEPKQVGLPDVS